MVVLCVVQMSSVQIILCFLENNVITHCFRIHLSLHGKIAMLGGVGMRETAVREAL